MFKVIKARVRSSLRYKLFVLVVFPALLAMVTTLALTIYWFTNFTRDNLFLKVESDLANAHHAFEKILQAYGTSLQRLADSYSFRKLFTTTDATALQKELRNLIQEEGFAFVHITDELGNWLYEADAPQRRSSKPTPLTVRALRGRPSAALEVFSPDDLLREDPTLPERVGVPIVDARPGTLAQRQVEDRTIVLRAVYPIRDTDGKALALLDGGVLLNGNDTLIEDLRERVYGTRTLPEGGLGAMAVVLDDVRVTTNFPLKNADNAAGTRVPKEIRDAVLGEGKGGTWVSRDRVGGRWYIAAYEPLFDVHGQGIGMLQTGFLEAPFRYSHYRAAALLLAIFLILIAISTWIALRGARSVFQPIERMTAVVRATHAGLDQRIGNVDSRDEVGELARQFDAMLELLKQRNREIQYAADQLEQKVDERTRELEKKNIDLEHTVSLLQQARQQLVITEKLAALGQMAAGIAHEINNPTTVILGNLDLLASELGGAANAVQEEIDLIVQQVDRIRYIVDSLLQFAKPSPTNDELDLQEVDINRAVEDTLPLVRHTMEKASIDVHSKFSASRTVCIRRYELQEVLINLLLNAARATPTGGTVEVTTKDWDQRGVVISVRDNGVGIAPDKLSRVFDPFFTTDKRHGTGLGLSVSYGLIRRYGGEITVKSELGSGTVFHVWLLEEPVIAARDETLEYSAGSEANTWRTHEWL